MILKQNLVKHFKILEVQVSNPVRTLLQAHNLPRMAINNAVLVLEIRWPFLLRLTKVIKEEGAVVPLRRLGFLVHLQLYVIQDPDVAGRPPEAGAACVGPVAQLGYVPDDRDLLAVVHFVWHFEGDVVGRLKGQLVEVELHELGFWGRFLLHLDRFGRFLH